MKSIRKVLAVLVPVGILGLAACATSDDTAGDSNALGIARFATVDSGSVTTITGYDASGVEVGHVAIVHGTFTASPEFADDFATPTVDGRTLSVQVGSQAYHWETEGYDPTLSLPAAPGRFVAMGTFLEQPQVVDVMKRWGIGFQHFIAATPPVGSALNNETPYLRVMCSDGEQQGVWPQTDGLQTGTNGKMLALSDTVQLDNGKSAGTCGGTVVPTQLGIITTTINSINQYVIYQECPDSTVSSTRLYQKSCPVSGTTSMCGTGTTSCKGCGAFTDYEGDTQYFDGHSETTSGLTVSATSTQLKGSSTLNISCN